MEQQEKCIAIYSRKSKFTGKGESIGNQVELCKGYVRDVFGEEWTERCVVFEDEGFSGGNLQRPDFLRMLEAVRRQKIRAIVVYRLDRISRNISDFAGLIDELTKLGVSFVSIKEQFDTATPMGRAMMFIISVFSQLERETIAERIRDNMYELAKTGHWLGGNTPTGFKSGAVSKVSLDGKERRSYKLIPLPEEKEIPRMIFDLYTETDSLTAVEAELLRRRIKTKKGKDFTRFAIKGILQNPVYMVADGDAYDYFTAKEADICQEKKAFDGTCGIIAYNRTNQEKGRTTQLLPMDRWIVAAGEHPGFVPSRQWIRVQESLERNKIKGIRKSRSNEALLTGLIYCTCGERMYPKLTQRTTPSGANIYHYVCKMKVRSKGDRCRNRNIGGNDLDEAILARLGTLGEYSGELAERLEKNRDFQRGEKQQQQIRLGRLRGELTRNEKTLCGLIDTLGLVDDGDARERVLQRIGELTKANQDIAAGIHSLEEQEETKGLSREEAQSQRWLLSDCHACLQAMTLEEKRAAVRAIVSKVVWDGTSVHVVLVGAEQMPWGEDSK